MRLRLIPIALSPLRLGLMVQAGPLNETPECWVGEVEWGPLLRARLCGLADSSAPGEKGSTCVAHWSSSGTAGQGRTGQQCGGPPQHPAV